MNDLVSQAIDLDYYDGVTSGIAKWKTGGSFHFELVCAHRIGPPVDYVIKAVHDTNPSEIQADVLSGYGSNASGNWWLSKGSERNPLGLWEESSR
jgi:hypothetical protein